MYGQVPVRSFAVVALVVTAWTAGCGWSEEQRFSKVLERHHTRYTVMAVQDLYKLVYQAAMGSEHALSDSLTAGKQILVEMARLKVGGTGVLCESISPGRDLVRVHLQAFAQSGEDTEALIGAFLHTARSYKGSTARLQRYWRIAERIAAEGRLPYSVEQLETYFAERAAEDYPPVRHSQRYRVAYEPAYRVVRRKFLSFPCRDRAG